MDQGSSRSGSSLTDVPRLSASTALTFLGVGVLVGLAWSEWWPVPGQWFAGQTSCPETLVHQGPGPRPSPASDLATVHPVQRPPAHG